MSAPEVKARISQVHRALDSKYGWAESLVGRSLGGRYRLDRLIDIGGMGAVFEATQLELARRVAVKVLLPTMLLLPKGFARFRQEARRAAAVRKRGVAEVMDFVIDPDLGPYLVMEYLEGEPLSTRIERERTLPLADMCRIGLELLDTLEAVHEESLVHRDLKPANVFLAREDGTEIVKVLDFGVARSLEVSEEESQLTGPGSVLGTPRYMAPEQARAEESVDHRADLYAIGAILYEACSGRRPYAEWPGQTVLMAVISGPTTPLAVAAPHLPRPLIELVDRAMAFDRSDRWQSASAMKTALEDVLAHLDEHVAFDDVAPFADAVAPFANEDETLDPREPSIDAPTARVAAGLRERTAILPTHQAAPGAATPRVPTPMRWLVGVGLAVFLSTVGATLAWFGAPADERDVAAAEAAGAGPQATIAPAGADPAPAADPADEPSLETPPEPTIGGEAPAGVADESAAADATHANPPVPAPAGVRRAHSRRPREHTRPPTETAVGDGVAEQPRPVSVGAGDLNMGQFLPR